MIYIFVYMHNISNIDQLSISQVALIFNST